jgi:hypothetical protein
MKRTLLEPDFEAWREIARWALRLGYKPEELDLQDAMVPTTLALTLESDEIPTGDPVVNPHVPKAFLDAAKFAAAHSDAQRWNLLYRILYRLQGNRGLLKMEADEDVAHLQRLEGQVLRDLHTMHAFVQFRMVLEPGSPMERPVVIDEPILASPDPHAHHLVLATPTPFGVSRIELSACEPEADRPELTECEHFIAWYEPEHRILPLAAPFFAERFSIMRWSILTPDASVSWDPLSRQLMFSAGLPRESAPADEELEQLWRTYHASINNSARRNP